MVFALLAGCASVDAQGRFREEALPRAAFEMDCAPDKTTVVELASSMIGVEGCGRKAVYLDVPSTGWREDTAASIGREPAHGTRWTLIGEPPAAMFPANGLRRASFEMSCTVASLRVARLDEDTVGVEGCGLTAMYVADDMPSSGRPSNQRRFWRALWIRPKR